MQRSAGSQAASGSRRDGEGWRLVGILLTRGDAGAPHPPRQPLRFKELKQLFPPLVSLGLHSAEKLALGINPRLLGCAT